jgi:hypothetical protein
VSDLKFFDLWARATEAGIAAGNAASVVPMMVADADPLTGAPIAGGQRYHVPDGVCGFAWISFKGNTAFGRWMKASGLARPDYPTGLRYPVHAFNQSLQRKEAFADAAARVLREAGIDAYSQSRMD